MNELLNNELLSYVVEMITTHTKLVCGIAGVFFLFGTLFGVWRNRSLKRMLYSALEEAQEMVIQRYLQSEESQQKMVERQLNLLQELLDSASVTAIRDYLESARSLDDPLKDDRSKKREELFNQWLKDNDMEDFDEDEEESINRVVEFLYPYPKINNSEELVDFIKRIKNAIQNLYSLNSSL